MSNSQSEHANALTILWVLLVVLFGGGAIFLAFKGSNLALPASQGGVALLGLWLSWLGLGGTAAGFLVTFQQLIRVKRSTEAADAALAAARRSLAALASSGEVERARLSLEAAKAASRQGNVVVAAESLASARQQLFKIRQRKVDILIEFDNKIGETIEQMAIICDDVERKDAVFVTKLQPKFRDYLDLVDTIQVRISEV